MKTAGDGDEVGDGDMDWFFRWTDICCDPRRLAAGTGPPTLVMSMLDFRTPLCRWC